MTPTRIEARNARGTVGLFLFGSLVMLAVALAALTHESPKVKITGALGTLFLGGGAGWLLRELTHPRIRLVLDGEGIEDVRSGYGRIPWSAIRALHWGAVAHTEFIAVELADPDPILERVAPWRRLLRESTDSLGPGPISIALAGLDQPPEVLRSHVERLSGRTIAPLATPLVIEDDSSGPPR